MARSPLFRTVRRLLRRSVRGSAEPVAPKTTKSGLTRRDIIKAAALIPVAAQISCGGDDGGGSNKSIAIIGGGIAGLSCAHWLAQAGVASTVFEAQMRVGGRMFTARGMLQGDQICELGGELIDTDHVVIPTLATAFSLPIDDLHQITGTLEQDTFFFDGAKLAEADIVTAFTPVATKMQMQVAAGDASDTEFERVDNLSIPDWLTQDAGLATTDLIFRLLTLSYLEEFGLEVEQQSAWNLITLINYDEPDPFEVFGVSDERYHLHDGSDSVPLAIADELGDAVVLDHALTKVAQDGDRFTLTFDTSGGEETVTVDHVVYALPFTKLREVNLDDAGLTDEKLNIIDNLGYGTNAKLMLQFNTRPWETNQQSDGGCITDVGELQTTWATSRGQDGAFGVLTNFVGGQRGLDMVNGTPEDQAQMVLPWIDTVFPGAAAEYITGSAIRQHWPSFKFNKGSYASYLVGQWSFFGLEGQRVGNQHFCGEHTSENFQGYMEGGAETGTLVAAEILDDLGLDQPKQLADLVEMITASGRVSRASYHGGDGRRMKLGEIRR